MSRPAPWTLRGDAYVLLAWTRQHPGLPVTDASTELRGRGWGALGFLRYAESDVGPYDELLWLVPWGLSRHGRRVHSVTRIYVSSEASQEGGRANWGIPKQLARFDVEPQGDELAVRVSSAAGLLASFRVAAGRSLGLDARFVPPAWLTLGQALDATFFRVTPSVRGRVHAARFTELVTDSARFVDLSGRAPRAALCIPDVELRFPPAAREALAG